MKNLLTRLFSTALISAGFATQLSAVTLDSTSTRYLGLINDGIPSSESQTAGYINILTGMAINTGPLQIPSSTGEIYTRSGNMDPTVFSFPTATTQGAVKLEAPDSLLSFNFGSGYTYLVAKYDQSDAGSLVWYVEGLIGSYDIQQTLNGHAISHIVALNPGSGTPGVPDGGSTVALLGGALMVIAGVARRVGSIVEI
jgi:hypothetical protein